MARGGFAGLVFVMGLQPYLGVKNLQSFAMFSNLRTEGPGNNHFFIPDLGLSNALDDLVIVHFSNDMAMQTLSYPVQTRHPMLGTFFLAPDNARIALEKVPYTFKLVVPRYMLAHRISEIKAKGETGANVIATTLAGESITIDNGDYPEGYDHVSLLERKLFRLRGVSEDLVGYCMW